MVLTAAALVVIVYPVIGSPPLDAGGDHRIAKEPLAALIVSPCGGLGWPTGRA